MKRLYIVFLAAVLLFAPTAAYADPDAEPFSDEPEIAASIEPDDVGSTTPDVPEAAPDDSDPIPSYEDAADAPAEVSEDVATAETAVSEPSEPVADGSDPADESDPSDDADAAAGWQTVDGSTFYIDPETGEQLASGFFEIDGSTYCFGPDGALVTGWVVSDGEIYYFDPSNGAMLTDGTADIQGLCAPIAAADGESFADVNGSSPHAEDIAWMLESGISTGWVSSDGTRTFRALSDVVRQDMAAFLYRLAGSPEFLPTEQDTSFFTDVDADTPHAAEIWWLVRTGISEGWLESDGTRTFRPMTTVYRADMAAFLYRLAGSGDFAPTEEDKAFFSDVTDSTPHATEIWWLAGTGVSEGWAERDGSRTFRPFNPIARADMAAFTHRTYSLESYEPPATHRYLFDDDGSLVTGWTDDGSYYDRSTGALVRAGWVVDGSDRRYIDPSSGEYLSDGIHSIAGYSYLFDADGIMQRGWSELDGAKRYFSLTSGAMFAGSIHKVDGSMYGFGEDGVLVHGWFEADGSTYYFDLSTGRMRYGLLSLDDGMYYLDTKTGKLVKNRLLVLDRCAYRADGTGVLRRTTFGQSLEAASAKQRKVAETAWNEPTTPAGWCAMWVHNVFECMDWYDINGNANDLFYSYCTSSNPADLKVGMIVAVPRHPGTPGGQIYGHIGIYVGNGLLLDSSGEVRTWYIEDWIDSYDGWVTPRWGWYGGRSLA